MYWHVSSTYIQNIYLSEQVLRKIFWGIRRVLSACYGGNKELYHFYLKEMLIELSYSTERKNMTCKYYL